MAELDNSRKTLTKGLVRLLRDNVNGWASVDVESGAGTVTVDNVWPAKSPRAVEEQFPYGAVSVTGGSDFDLSVELDVRLRENLVKITAFAENQGEAEDLIDDAEDAIGNNWEDYVGDWSFREVDGFSEINESGEHEGELRFSRSIDLIFETVKASDDF